MSSNDLTHAMTVTEDAASDLDSLPRGSYLQEYDGFYNYVYAPGRFMLCTPGADAARTAADLDFPVTVHFIPRQREQS